VTEFLNVLFLSLLFLAFSPQLQQDEILAMKEAGKGGKEIIDALTNNSATFQTKSEFSQEKYKKRKAKKYVQLACAKRPTTASICETLFNKQPSRIGYLRPDALGILLHMANVGPGSKILVLENCGGMITGAVAERMGGHGTVCATYLEPHPKGIEIVKNYNFTKAIMGTVTRAPLIGLLKMRKEQLERKGMVVEVSKKHKGTEVMPVDIIPSEADTTTAVNNVEEVLANNNHDNISSNINGSGSPPFSGCILCNTILHPKTALQALLPLLAPSASFAVWSQTLQPLADTMSELRSTGTAVNLMVQETWYRKQQVLPKRTHPTMSMNHGGGYLLSGIVTVAGTKLPLAFLPSL
jgi:tRNA (adenine58-N1)-methyltransferase non-catalytic subunit